MSKRADLEAKGIPISVDDRLQLSITDSKPLPPFDQASEGWEDWDCAQAKKKLGRWFGEKRLETRHAPDFHDLILKLLQKFPELASTYFGPRCTDYSAMPFYYLVGAKGIDLSIIKQVWELYPEAIDNREGAIYDLPLEYACEACAAPDIIEFLIDKQPQIQNVLVMETSLEYALSKFNTSPMTIELLTRASPRSWVISDSAFDNLVSGSCNPQLIASVVNDILPRHNINISSLSLCSRKESADLWRTSLERATQCLEAALPTLTHLSWTFTGCDLRDKDHLNRTLKVWQLLETSCSNLTHLELWVDKCTPWSFVWKPLWQLASTFVNDPHCKLRDLSVAHPTGTQNYDAYDELYWLVRHLRECLLSSMTLRGFGCKDLMGVQTMLAQLVQFPNLTKLEIKEFRIVGMEQQERRRLQCRNRKILADEAAASEGNGDCNGGDGHHVLDKQWWPFAGYDWQCSRLTSLSLTNCDDLFWSEISRSHTVSSLLDAVATMPCLTKFELWFFTGKLPSLSSDDGPEDASANDGDEGTTDSDQSSAGDSGRDDWWPEDITTPIIHLLKQGRLESLNVRGTPVSVNVVRLCEEALVPRRAGRVPPLHTLLLPSVASDTIKQVTELLFPDNHWLTRLEFGDDVNAKEANNNDNTYLVKIAYHTQVNRWIAKGNLLDRTPQQDSYSGSNKTTLDRLFHLLEQLEWEVTAGEENDPSDTVIDDTNGVFASYQIHYGLLRFDPNLWIQ